MKRCLPILVLCLLCAPSLCHAKGDENAAWNYLKGYLKGKVIDKVGEKIVKTIFKETTAKTINKISATDALGVLKGLEALADGDLDAGRDELVHVVLGLMVPHYGVTKDLIRAIHTSGEAILENWMEDLYDHRAYHELRDLLNKEVVKGYSSGDPYLPSHWCVNEEAVSKRMKTREHAMFRTWMRSVNTKELLYDGWDGTMSRLRQKLGFTPGPRQIFHHFLIRASHDQKAFFLGVFRRVHLRNASRMARREILARARRAFSGPAVGLQVRIEHEGEVLEAGQRFTARCRYSLPWPCKHLLKVVIRTPSGDIYLDKLTLGHSWRVGGIDRSISFKAPRSGGRYTIDFYVDNAHGVVSRKGFPLRVGRKAEAVTVPRPKEDRQPQPIVKDEPQAPISPVTETEEPDESSEESWSQWDPRPEEEKEEPLPPAGVFLYAVEGKRGSGYRIVTRPARDFILNAYLANAYVGVFKTREDAEDRVAILEAAGAPKKGGIRTARERYAVVTFTYVSGGKPATACYGIMNEKETKRPWTASEITSRFQLPFGIRSNPVSVSVCSSLYGSAAKAVDSVKGQFTNAWCGGLGFHFWIAYRGGEKVYLDPLIADGVPKGKPKKKPSGDKKPKKSGSRYALVTFMHKNSIGVLTPCYAIMEERLTRGPLPAKEITDLTGLPFGILDTPVPLSVCSSFYGSREEAIAAEKNQFSEAVWSGRGFIWCKALRGGKKVYLSNQLGEHVEQGSGKKATKPSADQLGPDAWKRPDVKGYMRELCGLEARHLDVPALDEWNRPVGPGYVHGPRPKAIYGTYTSGWHWQWDKRPMVGAYVRLRASGQPIPPGFLEKYLGPARSKGPASGGMPKVRSGSRLGALCGRKPEPPPPAPASRPAAKAKGLAAAGQSEIDRQWDNAKKATPKKSELDRQWKGGTKSGSGKKATVAKEWKKETLARAARQREKKAEEIKQMAALKKKGYRESPALRPVRVGRRRATIRIWDHDVVDGDRVAILLNGKRAWVGTLTKSPKTIRLDLRPGRNTVTFKALNTGRRGLNTAAFTVDGVVPGGGGARQGYGLYKGSSRSMTVHAPND